jgi:hypothetical protein
MVRKRSVRMRLFLFCVMWASIGAFEQACSSEASTEGPGVQGSGGSSSQGTGGLGGGTSPGVGGSSGGAAGEQGVGGSSGGAGESEAGAISDAEPPGFDPGNLDARTLPAPPDTWQEHWFEHNQLLKLIDYNDQVAIYFDDDVDRAAAAWVTGFMTKVWAYSRKTYGEMTTKNYDGRLYSIFHTDKYGGGHPSTCYDDSHDFRDVTDCGPGPWTGEDWDVPSHEAGHVVEAANNGVHDSPAFGLWGDSKWMEFYQYDLYVGLGMTEHAKEVLDRFSGTSDDFPRSGTHWFRDWFYPLWRDHGHAEVMVKFFRLLAAHFPKNGESYARGLNWGEFVHFMSGAAGKSVLDLAHGAFGPTFPEDGEFMQAKKDFPEISY